MTGRSGVPGGDGVDKVAGRHHHGSPIVYSHWRGGSQRHQLRHLPHLHRLDHPDRDLPVDIQSAGQSISVAVNLGITGLPRHVVQLQVWHLHLLRCLDRGYDGVRGRLPSGDQKGSPRALDARHCLLLSASQPVVALHILVNPFLTASRPVHCQAYLDQSFAKHISASPLLTTSQSVLAEHILARPLLSASRLVLAEYISLSPLSSTSRLVLIDASHQSIANYVSTNPDRAYLG
ncbi:hypothetical protein BHE74_00001943 [Ensete ventricosum]|nr:hypothetical protein BHE74_00001943 [Ensete ventricosum]